LDLIETHQIVIVQAEKGRRIIELCQIAGIFQIQIDRWFELVDDLTGECGLATLTGAQNRHSRIVFQSFLNRVGELPLYISLHI